MEPFLNLFHGISIRLDVSYPENSGSSSHRSQKLDFAITILQALRFVLFYQSSDMQALVPYKQTSLNWLPNSEHKQQHKWLQQRQQQPVACGNTNISLGSEINDDNHLSFTGSDSSFSHYVDASPFSPKLCIRLASAKDLTEQVSTSCLVMTPKDLVSQDPPGFSEEYVDIICNFSSKPFTNNTNHCVSTPIVLDMHDPELVLRSPINLLQLPEKRVRVGGLFA
ncbi:unnamed protein product [Protopolystoma xenopodis]|uniref:Uncharacterized protein n=1 Tax=Protopolystoma xenopodis TaxID=117903 RepID=A0A3S5FC88_9PLAT|nr:unnamed protein product [Protopolystoma xenopodis]